YDAMFVVSVDEVMTDVNARVTELTGYSREELIGSRAPFPFHDPQAPPERLAAERRLLREGGSGEFDQTLVHREGHRVEAVLSAAPLHGADGSVVGGVRLLRDVTAERAAGRALEASEARFRAFVEFAPDGVVCSDAGGRIGVVNARIEEMFGHRREQLVGRPVEMLRPAAARGAHAAHRAAYAADPHVRTMGLGRELLGLRADGSEFPIDVSLSPLETADGVMMMAAAVRDVTERRRAEAALREGEERYRSLITSMADGVVVHAASAQIIECNPAAERILGMSRDQLMRTAPRDPRWHTIRPDGSHYPLREHPAMRTLATGEPVRAELIGVRHPGAGTRWISVSTERLDAGGDAAVVSSFTDVTDRLDAEHDQAAQRRLATLVAAGADAREVFDAVAQEAALLCGADAGGVLRFTRGASPAVPMGVWFARPVPVALHGVPREFVQGTLSAELIATRRPVRRSAVAGDTITIAALPMVGEIDAAMAAPVFLEGEVWGSIMLIRPSGVPFLPGDEQRLVALAEVATLAIVSAETRERLAALATTDDLTGLANRRTFLDRLRTECARARGGGRPLSRVVLDVDRFKAINDRFGHPEGDRVLALIAQVARGVVRSGQELARIGGEEFAWIIPGAGGEGARGAAERLRAAVGATDFGRVGRISVSLGVAEYHALAGESDAELVARADDALYRAKRAGRDRVVLDAVRSAPGAR
ncbi:MAG: PAS domain S-box protein, partial [Miltoncostaeaceae bacterium]